MSCLAQAAGFFHPNTRSLVRLTSTGATKTPVAEIPLALLCERDETARLEATAELAVFDQSRPRRVTFGRSILPIRTKDDSTIGGSRRNSCFRNEMLKASPFSSVKWIPRLMPPLQPASPWAW